MSWLKKSYSMADMGCLPNRLMHQPMDVRLRSQRSVIRSDVETGRIAEMFVETEHRQKMREFFDLLDPNHTGVVSIRKLKAYMHSFLETPLEKHVTSQIHKKYDEHSDVMLNFQEFYQMSIVSKNNKFQRMVSKYCEIVVPPRVSHAESMVGLYEDNYSCWPPPLTMITFSIIQIIVFFVSACNNNTDQCNYRLAINNKIAMLLRYDSCNRLQLWRFFTYMFVHSDGAHLMCNLVMQICFGVPLELTNHWSRVTLIYLAGVLAGSIGQSITKSTSLQGASAGVYALLVSHIATVIMNWKEMYHPSFQLTFFLIYCAADFCRSFIEFRHGKRNIAYVAHLGGALAGLLIGIGVLRNFKKCQWQRKLWFCAIALFIFLLVAGIYINIFCLDSFVHVKCDNKKY